MKAIGKYQIIDEIGTGAAGTTYRVRDTAGERARFMRDNSAVTRLIRNGGF